MNLEKAWPTLLLIGLQVSLVFILLLRKFMRGPTRGSDNPKRLDGKLVVITGANTGIGKVTATDLAKRGARVIICCRDLKRGENALKDIKNESGSDNVELEQLDLASLQSVRKCAQKLLEKEQKIDYLINNAGVMMCPQWKTEDGFDMQMGTNHFGHFVWTNLLLPLVEKSASSGNKPRIVIVSSLAHMQATKGINFDDINYEKSFKTTQVYAQSKLANILHAKELARKLENSGISVHVLHPGVIMTELSRHFEKWIPSFINFLTLPIARFIFKTPFHGAQTTLFCVLDDSLEGQSGKYYADCGEAKTSGKYAQDAEYAKKFWRFSEELISNKKTQ